MNPVRDFSEQLYVKIGRRYYPVARFEGFPADGVWLVESEKSSQRLVTSITVNELGLLPDPMPALAVERHRDTIQKALSDHYDTLRSTLYGDGQVTHSIREVADTVIAAIAEAERERNAAAALKQIFQEPQ